VLGIAIPEFWLGTMLALIFGVRLGWLPVAGAGDIRSLILPALTLATGVGAFYSTAGTRHADRGAGRAPCALGLLDQPDYGIVERQLF
jgi:hypothetical protein